MHHITWYQLILPHTISYHIISYYKISYQFISHHFISHHIIPYSIIVIPKKRPPSQEKAANCEALIHERLPDRELQILAAGLGTRLGPAWAWGDVEDNPGGVPYIYIHICITHGKTSMDTSWWYMKSQVLIWFEVIERN